MDYETYKPHWKRRVTLAREREKAKCLFDVIETMVIVFYLIVGSLWVLNDAFPNLFW